MENKSDVINAIKLGLLCSISYLAVYVARNILGVVTPRMLETGMYTLEYIGAISTGYMIFYAVGQLINGIVGDKIIARYMISLGLIFAGICNALMPVSTSLTMSTVLYSLSGFFLSMIYGPMTKVVSENVAFKYATRCALGYTLASFLGSPAAGVIAMFFDWNASFYICGGLLILMGVICFILFLLFEKKGIVKYNVYKTEKTKGGGIKALIENEIIKYSFVSILTGIVRTTVVFWVPTYLTQYIGFSSNTSVGIFTGITLAMSLAPYIDTIVLYEMVFKRNRDRTLIFMFVVSAISFLVMFLCKQPVINIVFLVLALMTNGGAATILWSVYCPSLSKTGMVSSATGYLDFLSYMAAAAANMIFANAVSQIGWAWLIVIWCLMMCVGVVISLPIKKLISRKK